MAEKPEAPKTIPINVNDGSQTRIIRTREDGTVEDLTPPAPATAPQKDPPSRKASAGKEGGK